MYPSSLCSFLTSPISFQSSWLNLLSSHLYSVFAVYLPSNSPLWNFLWSSFLAHLDTSLYSSLNLFTRSLALPKFFFGSQVSSSAVYPFYHTKYLSFSLNFFLFSIFSTLYSSSSLITTKRGHSFLWPSTWSLYIYTLLMFTTGCIFIVLGSSSSISFVDIILFIL